MQWFERSTTERSKMLKNKSKKCQVPLGLQMTQCKNLNIGELFWHYNLKPQ